MRSNLMIPTRTEIISVEFVISTTLQNHCVLRSIKIQEIANHLVSTVHQSLQICIKYTGYIALAVHTHVNTLHANLTFTVMNKNIFIQIKYSHPQRHLITEIRLSVVKFFAILEIKVFFS